MARREQIGSWIEGAPQRGAGGRGDLGLPSQGRGSQASLGRRVLALAIDWALASVISFAFFGYEALATLAVFAVSTLVLVSTAGFTIGHRLAGLQVVRVVDLVPPATGGARRHDAPASPWPPPGLLLGTVRTVLVCLVVPAVVWDSSGRGLHDVAAGTVIVLR